MAELFVAGDNPPRLKGQRCGNCGRIAFPPNPYGCESCGASGVALHEQLLKGNGRLLAFVTTHHAPQRYISVPFTVASIALEDGVVIRALMGSPVDAGLHVGDPVEAIIVEIPEQGHQLRFLPTEAN